ncbi:MAG: hypothetical protein HKN94_02620 [Acidimicrobiales bacterium]|nr:hypothetical protein [Acidimicrobiales bacterium]RZV47188.1 MAG: hypothetical protein EX269_05415 [Acidimicrobiales bacterium]
MARHLSGSQLAMWLDGEAPHFDDHVDQCEKCAARLSEVDEPQADLRPALLTLLKPPPDLESRVSARIAARLKAREEMALLGGLLGVSIETGRIMFDEND